MSSNLVNWLSDVSVPLRLGSGVVALCLTASLGYQLYHDSQLLLQPSSDSPEESSSSDTRPTASASNQMSIAQLATLNLMGTANHEQNQVAPSKDLPETRLQLVLQGTFASTETDNASVLIAEKGKPGQRYHINDNLPGGATVASINANSVVLSRNGRQEILNFPKPVSPSGSARTQRSTRFESSSSRAQSSRRPSSGRENNMDKTSRAESIKERLARLRNRQKNNSNTASDNE